MIKYFKAMPSLTRFIVFSFAVILTYTVVELVLSSTTGINHDTLTTCLYACFSGEVLSCALIKVFKLKEEDKKPDNMTGDLLTEEEIHDLLNGMDEFVKEKANANG